jgi:hypothetical protein
MARPRPDEILFACGPGSAKDEIVVFHGPVLGNRPKMEPSMRPSRFDQFAIAVIVLGLLARLFLAYSLTLGNDEAYAVAASREFSISFFDHPPIPFWLSQLGAMAIGEFALAYRIPFVILGTGTAVLIWQIGRLLGGEKVGFWSVLLWHLTPHLFAASGIFVLPEGPMNFFCLAALFTLGQDIGRDQDRPRAWTWLLAGGFLALALASKYNAGIFALAVFGYLLTSTRHRPWLAHWQPWAGAAVGLLGVLPVIAFGIQTDWASFRFHSGRTGGSFDIANIALMYSEQVRILAYFNALVLLIGMIAALKSQLPLAKLVLWTAAMGMLAFVPIYAFGTDTHAHWTMPGWLLAAPLGALWLCTPVLRRLWMWGIGVWGVVFWSFSAIGFFEMTTGELTRQTGQILSLARNREMRDLTGFRDWMLDRGWLDGVKVIGVDNWETGGRISTLFAGEYGIQTIGSDGRHFQFHSAAKTSKSPILIVIGIDLDRQILDRRAHSALMGHNATITHSEYFDILHGGLPLATIAVHRLAW